MIYILPAISQSGGDAVVGDMDRAFHQHVVVSGAVALQAAFPRGACEQYIVPRFDLDVYFGSQHDAAMKHVGWGEERTPAYDSFRATNPQNHLMADR